ncbi:HupE/UreJ family protein [Cyanobium sp. Morenito 9A2]|uniref:HupE/UreJ family protein n=1 Tax=Cyanobium sp. Morenito 9A2 TaxID=2823718 RepID=UPI0020CCAA5B|nr:HupE/UreJ family protein [Cyanobium sp. Morenito 9A2]MCP9850557.1 HupE/UreJ family protein [Cyanobium sp. Morenito 9A2]
MTNRSDAPLAPRGSRAPSRLALGALALPLLLLLGAAPVSAHHLMGLFQLKPGPLAGILSGLGHPVLGPDHLLFLLALGLAGLQQPRRWLVGLLATGLAASGLGLWLPGLPGAEVLVALSLVAVGLVLNGRLPRSILVPAFALHGYVLSAAVLGWEPTPIAFYLLGLLISQALLLTAAVTLVRRWGSRLSPADTKLAAGVLIGIGASLAWTTVVP